MENSTPRRIDRTKILWLIGMLVFALAFIFSCLEAVLPFGRMIVGTFGILSYPLFLLSALICLAKFLGFSYTRRAKPTAYFLLALFSVLFVIHSISTYSMLSPVVNADLLKLYLVYSYNTAITLLGSVGSIITGIVSMLLGGMGTIILFAILGTVFVGLFVDYMFYGRYEPHIKKLKSRKLREKVSTSDAGRTADNKPNYSFSNDDEAVGELTVDAENLENEMRGEDRPTPIYTSGDVVGEISDGVISEEAYPNLYTGYNGYNYEASSDEPQQPNEFSDNVYRKGSYPDVYSTSLDDYRRQFIHDTFNITPSADVQPEAQSMEQAPAYNMADTFGATTQNETYSDDATAYSQGDGYRQDAEYKQDASQDDFSAASSDDEGGLDDELMRMLGINSEDLEDQIKSDVSENYNSSSYGFDYNSSENSNSKVSEEQPKPAMPTQPMSSASPTFSAAPVREPEKFNSGSLNTFETAKPQPQKYTVPAKETRTNPYGFNVAMAGVRYNPPPLSLLISPPTDSNEDYSEEQTRKSAQLENVLAAFNVPAKVKNIVRGAQITRYELSVPLGVSVNKIPTYEKDIAAALAAKTITIKAPIPGSSYVGIELENDTASSVYERELLESDAFQNCKDPLAIAIGKDISGEIVVKSLAKLVHMLVAGSTGSGKSVFIHNIILSLIYKLSPDDLRLILIDPKKVEFNMYNGLPHLLMPEVVSTAEKAINALKWCVKEMERRYELMSKAGYNNIEPYNKSELVKQGQFEKFPYIVIIVDELAELIMANKKEAEACIQRLTQLARACGMHLVLATQRPSVDIISGVIKNNIPTRVAFSLQSAIDSKTILNSAGAEKLLGHGDMIFAPTGTSATPRLQGGYATPGEIRAVIDYDIKNNPSSYDDAVNAMINSEQPSSVDSVGGGQGGAEPPKRDAVDDYFKTAVKLVMQNNGASMSYLQRRLSVGYSRAARMIDQMVEKGYVMDVQGSKVKKVVITPEKFKEDFGEDYDSID